MGRIVREADRFFWTLFWAVILFGVAYAVFGCGWAEARYFPPAMPEPCAGIGKAVEVSPGSWRCG